MEKLKNQTEMTHEEQQRVPYRLTRRERRKNPRTVYNNNRKPKGTGFLQMGVAWDGQVIYMPKRKKLKGYQKSK